MHGDQRGLGRGDGSQVGVLAGANLIDLGQEAEHGSRASLLIHHLHTHIIADAASMCHAAGLKPAPEAMTIEAVKLVA